MRRTFLFAVIMTLLSFSSLSWAEETTYRKHIKPIFDAKCIVCHGAGSPEHPEFKEDQKKFEQMMKGPKMDTYVHLIFFVGWPDTGAVMRRLDDGKNTKDGKSGNMYQYLGSTEEERQKNLNLFKEWVGNWTLKRWKEISREEIDGIKVKY
jgi:hypothetical protein